MDAMDDGTMVLCCQCAVPIPPNALNMCASCLQTRYDIGAGISKQVQQHTCRGCNRYERRDGSWAVVEPESKELLALLLRKPRGLAAARLADASFIWTEPHSRRLKLKVTIQKEVVSGAVLQQQFTVEFILSNKQCTGCQRREAKDTWVAVLQMRQKVPHKRTFLWIEQLILKHRAHADTTNVVEMRDGLDFYFDQRAHAEKLVSFLQSVAPVRCKHSKQLISTDTHTGKGRHKFTYAVEVLPICRDDLVYLPRATANSLSQLPRLALCHKVSNVLHLMDPFSQQASELQARARAIRRAIRAIRRAILRSTSDAPHPPRRSRSRTGSCPSPPRCRVPPSSSSSCSTSNRATRSATPPPSSGAGATRGRSPTRRWRAAPTLARTTARSRR